MGRSLVAPFFGLLGLATLGIGSYGLVEEWLGPPGPALELSTSEVDLGRVVKGQEPEVEVTLHNRSGRDLRVLGEQFA